MIKLANNYSYRFIRDDVKVTTICKRKTNDTLIADFDKCKHVMMNPLRYIYYTEPVVGNDGVVRNTLLAFQKKQLCSDWLQSVKNSQQEQLKSSKIEDVQLLDVAPSLFDDKIVTLEFNLYDIKSVSEELRVALMVIIDIKDTDYDVYYYNSKLKQTNY